MCLGIPGRIVSVAGMVAMVDFWGTCKPVSLDDVAEPLALGDYVIHHAGAAVRRIPAAEVADTIALYESILAECDVCDLAAEELMLVTAGAE